MSSAEAVGGEAVRVRLMRAEHEHHENDVAECLSSLVASMHADKLHSIPLVKYTAAVLSSRWICTRLVIQLPKARSSERAKQPACSWQDCSSRIDSRSRLMKLSWRPSVTVPRSAPPLPLPSTSRLLRRGVAACRRAPDHSHQGLGA